MAVPLGFVAGARVAVPGGARPVEDLRPGDEVLTWSEGRLATARVVDVVRARADQVAAIELGEGGVAACAPGTAFYDAFEEAWRAAGSLSATSEVLVLAGDGVAPRPVLEVPERQDAVALYHLRLAPPADAYFVDGVLARHKEDPGG